MTERDIREAIRVRCAELDEHAGQLGLGKRSALRSALLPVLIGAGLAVAGCSDDGEVPTEAYGIGPVGGSSSTTSSASGGGGQGGEAGQGGAGGQTAQGGGGQGGGGGDAGSGGMGAPVYMAPDVFV